MHNNFMVLGQGCGLAEPCGPWRLTFVLRRLENLCFFIEIICWAHWISQVQSTGLPSIFLRALHAWILYMERGPNYCSYPIKQHYTKQLIISTITLTTTWSESDVLNTEFHTAACNDAGFAKSVPAVLKSALNP